MHELAGQRPGNPPLEATVDEDIDGPFVLAAQRDRAQFAVLYRAYVNPVYKFCHRRLRNRQAAEDATSRIFEQAIVALPKFRRGSFRAWLFTIARNTVTDVHRRDRTPLRLPEGWDAPDHRPGPEDVAISNELRVSLPDLLHHLSTDQRTVIELRLAELSNREIAQVMNRSEGSIRTLQYRALSRARHTFEQTQSRHKENTHEST